MDKRYYVACSINSGWDIMCEEAGKPAQRVASRNHRSEADRLVRELTTAEVTRILAEERGRMTEAQVKSILK